MEEPKELDLGDVDFVRKAGRELELIVHDQKERVMNRLQACRPESVQSEALSLEEIFVTTVKT
jgi:hypothetical protein